MSVLLTICMQDMDAKEKKQRFTAGIWNEVLQENTSYTSAAEINECGDKAKTWNQKKCCSTDQDRKLKLFGHICRMDDNRLVKIVVFGMMNGKNKRGRPSMEWIDDIKEWCQTDIHTLISMTQDQSQWRWIVNEAINNSIFYLVYSQKEG